ncbi:MAG TPA: ABC transporter permease [Bryobacteraceae bacterium]|nr:ABC transporter permease [Bryobacteraceae bacterium]
MRTIFADLKFVLRSLGRNPSLVAAAVLSLALGIGANTAIFTLTDQILLRTLPVKEPRQLVLFQWAGQFIGGTTRGYEDAFAYPAYAELRDANPGVFSGIAARYEDTVDIADKGVAQRGVAELASGNYFDVLGVKAAIGRIFTPAEDQVKDSEPYAVISYEYWQRRFGGDPQVLNRSIEVNGHPMTIIGVAERGFTGFEAMSPADVFVPLAMKTVVTPTWDDRARRNSIWLRIFARLTPGTDVRTAQSAMSIPYHSVLQNDLTGVGAPQKNWKRYLANRLYFTDASKGFGGFQELFGKPLYVLLAMVGTLLLIACVNVANLLITRAAARQKEIAIRLSLGATRGALIRLVMTESAMVAAVAGLLGVLIAMWLTSLLVGILPYPNIGAALHTTPDMRILAFTAGVSLVAAILFGSAPALQGTHPDLAVTLKSESGKLSAGAGQSRLRKLLVAAQVALSLLLLIGAGLFARSLYSLLSAKTGIETTQLLAFSIDPSLHRYTPERSRHLFTELEDKLQRLPGVTAASGASYPILADVNWQNTAHVEGYHPREGENMNPGFNQVLPGFFQAVGSRLIAGRDFSDRDRAGSPKVVIVNETFANRFYPHESAVGHRLGWGPDGPLEFEIVGVARDIKSGNLRDKPRPWTFTAALQDATPSEITFYLRTGRDPLSLAQAARQSVRSLDASLPVFNLKTMETQIEETHFLDRLFAWLSVAFGILATLLASVGLYGVTAYAVARRTQEIGIRIALGASRTNVLRMVLSEIVFLVGAGVAAGALAALALGRLVESQLFGIKANDPLVIGMAVGVIVAVTALAAYVPARRATGIDPMSALRYE